MTSAANLKSGMVIKVTAQVSVSGAAGDTNQSSIHYTMDGTVPGSTAPRLSIVRSFAATTGVVVTTQHDAEIVLNSDTANLRVGLVVPSGRNPYVVDGYWITLALM
ncbi:MAG: hypothetical protein WBA28_04885 [Microbacteriaceae bacterium]